MRKYLSFLILICSLNVSAQLNFKAGAAAGLLTSQVQGDTYAGFYKIGITGGAHVDIGWSNKITTRLEFLYSPKGSKNKPDPKSSSYTTFKLTMDYIEIPITLLYTIADGISLDAGLYYGVLISSSQKFNGNDFAINPPYNRGDIGGHFGATYYRTKKQYFQLRYSGSILPTRSKPNPSTGLGSAWDGGGYNICIHFMVGVEF